MISNAFHETTPNHGFLFPEKVQNGVKERRKENQERGEGKRTRQPFFIWQLSHIPNSGEALFGFIVYFPCLSHIHTIMSRKHDLGSPVFKIQVDTVAG